MHYEDVTSPNVSLQCEVSIISLFSFASLIFIPKLVYFDMLSRPIAPVPVGAVDPVSQFGIVRGIPGFNSGSDNLLFYFYLVYSPYRYAPVD